MGVLDYFTRKQSYPDSTNTQDDQTEKDQQARARAIREARLKEQDRINQEEYRRTHDKTSVANRNKPPLPPQKAQPKPEAKKPQKVSTKQQLTPQQQIQIAKLQLRAQQIQKQNNRAYRQQVNHALSGGTLSNDPWTGDAGTYRTISNLNNLTDNINRYNNNIGSVGINFDFQNINDRLAEFDDRINNLFGSGFLANAEQQQRRKR